MNRLRMFTLVAATLIGSPAVSEEGFNVANCLAEHTKAECTRQMLIEDSLSKPLAAGEEVVSTSGALSVTVQGEDWLRNGWGSHPDKAKDLGLIKDSGVGVLTAEPSTVPEAEFEATLTEDMKALYKGLEEGFRKGKITIRTRSELELMGFNPTGGSGLLARLCYFIDVKEGKSVCVYEGLVTHAGQSYKLLGSIGDYNHLRDELENIITSLQFKN